MIIRPPKLKTLIIALAGAALCGIAIWAGVSNLARSMPPQAFKNSEFNDARLLARQAEMILMSSQQPSAINLAGDYAKRALIKDPTVVSAVRTLAALSELKNDDARALKLMRYAQKLSRRDFATHYWFINFEANQNNVAGALEHYDAALRTSRAAEPILMPILLSALDDRAAAQDLVDPLAEILARRPAWASRFITRSQSEVQSTETLMQLALTLKQKGHPINPASRQVLINRAVADNLYLDALRLSARPKHNDFIYNRNFSLEPTYPPFDWVLSSSQNLKAERVSKDETGRNYLLNLVAGSGRSGILAKQLLLLAPGTYDLKARVSNVPAEIADRPFITLRCASGTKTAFATKDFPQAGGAPTDFGFTFRLPQHGCAAQWIEISARASNQIGGTKSDMESIRISRALQPS
jgi:hypothetical protein